MCCILGNCGGPLLTWRFTLVRRDKLAAKQAWRWRPAIPVLVMLDLKSGTLSKIKSPLSQP